jgi:hypothetical protein
MRPGIIIAVTDSNPVLQELAIVSQHGVMVRAETKLKSLPAVGKNAIPECMVLYGTAAT